MYKTLGSSLDNRIFCLPHGKPCEQHVRDVEMGSFIPLVFSTFGGMGGAATTAYKRLASLLAAKRDHSYSSVVSWIRCSTSFSLL